MDNTIMQRENERGRITVPGRRTDNGEYCTLLVVHHQEGNAWSFFPHGASQLGVRVDHPDAVRVAQTITGATLHG